MIVGRVLSAVVKLKENGAAIGFPDASVTPVLTVTTYVCASPNSPAAGRNVAVRLEALYDTDPDNAAAPTVTLIVEPLMVAAFIGSLKRIVTGEVTSTFIAPPTGDVETTVGAVTSTGAGVAKE
jgi:hypothetical protein